jgi:hypothetical protein
VPDDGTPRTEGSHDLKLKVPLLLNPWLQPGLVPEFLQQKSAFYQNQGTNKVKQRNIIAITPPNSQANHGLDKFEQTARGLRTYRHTNHECIPDISGRVTRDVPTIGSQLWDGTRPRLPWLWSNHPTTHPCDDSTGSSRPQNNQGNMSTSKHNARRDCFGCIGSDGHAKPASGSDRRRPANGHVFDHCNRALHCTNLD